MIRHYLTFERQADLLHQAFSGWTIVEIWSQEKDRLILSLLPHGELAEADERDHFMEIALDRQIGYALPLRQMHRARRKSIDHFADLIGRRINRVRVDDAERAVWIDLHHDGIANDRLLIPFFGGGGNVLHLRGEKVMGSFRNVGEEYDALIAGKEDEIVSRDELRSRARSSDRTPVKTLSQLFRWLGPRLATEALWRAGYERAESLSNLSDGELDQLFGMIDQLVEECRASTRFHIYTSPDDFWFSLIRMEHVAGNEETEWEEFDDLPRAIRVFRSLYYRTTGLERIANSLRRLIERERKKVVRSLEHARNAQAHRDRGDDYEEQGNLLLAYLHQVRRGDERVKLTDWEGKEITIQLDPKLAPGENADRLFRKARGARIEADQGKVRAVELAERLERLDAERAEVDAATEPAMLAELATTYRIPMDREKEGEKRQKGGTDRSERFRHFTVDGGFDVYAGKNAATNDELTVRFAKPNDIWLHARGTSGSHVVLRWNDPKGRPPKRTLEEAAMIAAFYSGAKHSNLVPVAWTRKKFVRKPKGAAVGAVVMTREEVVMVQPRLPAGSDPEG